MCVFLVAKHHPEIWELPQSSSRWNRLGLRFALCRFGRAGGVRGGLFERFALLLPGGKSDPVNSENCWLKQWCDFWVAASNSNYCCNEASYPYLDLMVIFQVASLSFPDRFVKLLPKRATMATIYANLSSLSRRALSRDLGQPCIHVEDATKTGTNCDPTEIQHHHCSKWSIFIRYPKNSSLCIQFLKFVSMIKFIGEETTKTYCCGIFFPNKKSIHFMISAFKKICWHKVDYFLLQFCKHILLDPLWKKRLWMSGPTAWPLPWLSAPPPPGRPSAPPFALHPPGQLAASSDPKNRPSSKALANGEKNICYKRKHNLGWNLLKDFFDKVWEGTYFARLVEFTGTHVSIQTNLN